MNSTIFNLRAIDGSPTEPPVPSLADALASGVLKLQAWLDAVFKIPRKTPAADLLALAAAYEATQPSFAADLRAAAIRAANDATD